MLAKKMEIGSRLRECRSQAKLTLREVAASLKMSYQAVSHWENGHTVCDSIQLADLALLYGVSADYILFGIRTVPAELRALYRRIGGNLTGEAAQCFAVLRTLG